MDKLDNLAKDPTFEGVNFISICCDKCDGAREILEKNDEPLWQNVNHYYMSQSDKEKAKQILGFSSVPFYVILNKDGDIIQSGNKVDFDQIVKKEEIVENEVRELSFDEDF